jgi:hypothetical protein
LTIKAGISMTEAIASARAESKVRFASGFDQTALDEAARQGFAAGAFEESEEEGAAVVQEFYPDAMNDLEGIQTVNTKLGLADKLGQKVLARQGIDVGAALAQ